VAATQKEQKEQKDEKDKPEVPWGGSNGVGDKRNVPAEAL